MKLSKYFISTLKEAPADAEIISHKLLIRAGMIKKTAAGIYSFLPLGKKVLAKVENIVRDEMNKVGAFEVLMPVLQPADLWKKTKRWEEYGPEMMRLKDRNDRDFALGPTHEELITSIASQDIKSYKDLPVNLYQIQVKFRDEIRPRFGLMRAREFIMKDAYSFHASEESLHESYQMIAQAYSNIIKRCGLDFRSVKADAGLIGGDVSEEFMVIASTGEDSLLYCKSCDYGANIEQASANTSLVNSDDDLLKVEKISTPSTASIEEVSTFLKVKPSSLVKTLVYLCDDEPILVLLPGNRDANEVKIKKALNCVELRLFSDEDFSRFKHLVKGYIGPVGLSEKILADTDVLKMKNFYTGANEEGYHLKNVNINRDFKVAIVADVKYASAEDTCPSCSSDLHLERGIEIGHIFKLGTKYSEALGANYLDKDGKSNPLIMGCYGIGVTRLIAATIEQSNDEKGIIWPKNIAPFDCIVIQTDMKDQDLTKEAEKLVTELESNGLDVAYDDREDRAGSKFADADLIGYPLQIIFGKTFKEQDKIEIKIRSTLEKKLLSVDESISFAKELLK